MNTENNKLFAEFLGWKQQTHPKERWFGQWFKPNYGWIKENELSIDSDWNNLMNVVEKIEQLNGGIYQVDILQEGCKILKHCKLIIDKTILKVPEGTTKQESVVQATKDFIILYNNNFI